MNPKILIRRAQPADIDAMTGLIALVFAVEEDFTIDGEKQRQGLRMLLNDVEKNCLLVADHDNMIVGMCSAQLLVSTAEGGLKALVEDVVVAKDFRGQGIGRKMLVALGDWANAQGAKRLDLLADTSNKNGLAFYNRQGWKKTNLIALQKR